MQNHVSLWTTKEFIQNNYENTVGPVYRNADSIIMPEAINEQRKSGLIMREWIENLDLASLRLGQWIQSQKCFQQALHHLHTHCSMKIYIDKVQTDMYNFQGTDR